MFQTRCFKQDVSLLTHQVPFGTMLIMTVLKLNQIFFINGCFWYYTKHDGFKTTSELVS